MRNQFAKIKLSDIMNPKLIYAMNLFFPFLFGHDPLRLLGGQRKNSSTFLLRNWPLRGARSPGYIPHGNIHEINMTVSHSNTVWPSYI